MLLLPCRRPCMTPPGLPQQRPGTRPLAATTATATWPPPTHPQTRRGQAWHPHQAWKLVSHFLISMPAVIIACLSFATRSLSARCLLAGTPAFGYVPGGTPALDQRTPGTVDAFSPAPFNPTAATPPVGLTPALDDGETFPLDWLGHCVLILSSQCPLIHAWLQGWAVTSIAPGCMRACW